METEAVILDQSTNQISTVSDCIIFLTVDQSIAKFPARLSLWNSENPLQISVLLSWALTDTIVSSCQKIGSLFASQISMNEFSRIQSRIFLGFTLCILLVSNFLSFQPVEAKFKKRPTNPQRRNFLKNQFCSGESLSDKINVHCRSPENQVENKVSLACGNLNRATEGGRTALCSSKNSVYKNWKVTKLDTVSSRSFKVSPHVRAFKAES